MDGPPYYDEYDESSEEETLRSKPKWKRNSRGAMVGGIVMTSIGGPLALIGVNLLALGDTTTCYDGVCTGDDYRQTGLVLTVLGGAGVAIGIPLIVSGAKRVPVGYASLTLHSRGVTLQGHW